MKDDILSEALTISFNEIKQALREGQIEDAQKRFSSILRATAAREVMESYLSFATQYYSKGKAIAELIENCILHYQDSEFGRVVLKLKYVIQELADAIGVSAENLASYQFIVSAMTSLQNRSQFAMMLSECLREPEFQSSGEDILRASHDLLASLQGDASSFASAPASTPVVPPQQKPSTPPTQKSIPKTAPKQGFFSSLDEPIKPLPSGLDEPLTSFSTPSAPATQKAPYVPNLDDPIYDAPAPKKTIPVPDLDAPLVSEEPAKKPAISKSGGFPTSFDAPLSSFQEETSSSKVEMIEKLEQEIAVFIATNQLTEAIAFSEEILVLDPSRKDIEKKIQFLRHQIASKSSQETTKSFVKIFVLIFVLIFGGIGGYNFLGMQNVSKLRKEYASIFTAQNINQTIAQTKVQISKTEDLVEAYQQIQKLLEENPYQRIGELEELATKFGYSYHGYSFGLELDRIKNDAGTYQTILEEIKNVFQSRTQDFFYVKFQEVAEIRKNLTVENYQKALETCKNILAVAEGTKDSENLERAQKETDECQQMLDSLIKKNEERQKDLATRNEEAQQYLNEIEEALQKNDFSTAFMKANKIANDPRLSLLEKCSDLKIPIGIQSSIEDIEVTLNGQALGSQKYLFFPHKLSHVELVFSKKGFESKTKTLFKQDLQPTLEVELERGIFWSYKTEGPIEAPIQLQKDVLYIANRNAKFFAIQAKTGKELWSLKVSDGLSDIVLPFVLKDGKAYCVSNDRRIYCLDLNKQELLWKSSPSQKALKSTICLLEEDLFCISYQKSLVFFSSQTGKVLTDWETAGRLEMTPVFYQEALYFGDEERGYYRVPSASLVKSKVSQKNKAVLKPKLKLEGALKTSPVIEGKMHYLCLDTKAVMCVEEDQNGDFKLKWKFQMVENAEALPLLRGNTLYVASTDKEVYAIDKATGTLRWNFTTGDTLRYSPGEDEHSIYIAGRDKTLYSIQKDSGKLLWKKTFSETLENVPLAHQGLLFVCDGKGTIQALICD